MRVENGTGRGRTLLIGVPLVHVLSLDQFNAIVAHEMFHFIGKHAFYGMVVAPLLVAMSLALRRLEAMRAARNWFREWWRPPASLPRLALLIFRKAFSTLNRKAMYLMEFQADEFAAATIGAAAFRSALNKLAGQAEFFEECLDAHIDKVIKTGRSVENYFEAFRRYIAPALEGEFQKCRSMAMIDVDDRGSW